MSTFDCTDIKAILSGLVDGELDAQARHLAERHLSGCAPCRGLLSEAESLDELIAADIGPIARAPLPDGFVGSVMSRTVYARMYEQAGWSWTSWAGWVAAAACLGLAMSLWVLDRQSPRHGGEGLARNDGAPREVQSDAPALASESSGLRSWTWEGDVRLAGLRSAEEEYPLDDATRRAIDEQLALAQPIPGALEEISRRPALAAEDALALDSTSMVLQMLIDADLRSFADIERARQVAVYDEVAQRLADLRPRLRPADRAVVMAAESIILRIVNGPLDLDDLRMLHDTAESMNLARQIGSISSVGDASKSL